MKQVRGWVDLQMLSSQKSFKNPLANDKDKSRQKQNFAFFFNFQKTDEKYKQMNVKVSQAGGTYSLWQVSCLNNWDSHCHRTPPPLPIGQKTPSHPTCVHLLQASLLPSLGYNTPHWALPSSLFFFLGIFLFLI